jgi:hypothetical protein
MIETILCTRRARWLPAAVMLCACSGGDPAEQPELGSASEALFVASGTTLWNNNGVVGTQATIPVCFTRRPILQSNGSVRCAGQTDTTDCDGKSQADDGHTYSPSVLIPLVRHAVENTWMRYANIEFVNWGFCAVDPATNMHVESNFAGWMMVHFGDGDVTDAPLGKRTTIPEHISINWDAALTTTDPESSNIPHEFGHALGFEHEWERPDWTGWKCGSGPITVEGLGLQCLEVVGGNSDGSTMPDGTAVQVAACDGSTKQDWQQGWSGSQLDGTLRAYGKCLDIFGAGPIGSGTKVQLYSCNGGSNQQWSLTSDRHLTNPSTGLCLDVPSGQSGLQLQVYTCNSGSNQHWSYPGNPIQLQSHSNKCVDVRADSTTDGTAVQLYDCNRGDSQSFIQGYSVQNSTLTLDGTLRVAGKCLTVAGNGTANHSLIEIDACTGSASQIWAIQNDGTIKNPQSGRCLNDPNTSTTNGTQLELLDCAGGGGQIWQVPNNIAGSNLSTSPDPSSLMQYCVSKPSVHGLSAWDVLGAQKAYGRKYTGSLVGYRGQCANVQNASTTLGTPIVGYPCRGAWNDTWSRPGAANEPFQTTANSRCLNVTNSAVGNPLVSATCSATAANERFATTGVEWRAMGNMCVQAVGTSLRLEACAGGSGQLWDFFHPVGGLRNDQIRLSGTNSCVAATTSTGALGQALTLATCNASDTKQRFSVPGSGRLTLSNNTGLCANVQSGTTTSGNPIILWNDCSSTPGLNSQFSLSGVIHAIGGGCLTTTSPADPGNTVVDASCDANNATTQLWDYYF